MAEALGVASAITTLLEISTTILDTGYNYIRKVAKAPSELRKLLTEISAIDTLLSELSEISNTEDGVNRTLTSLINNGHLQSCQDTLHEARTAIESCRLIEGERVKNAGRRLTWPFKEGQVQALLSQLERHRRHLSDAVVLESRAALSRLEKSTKAMETKLSKNLDDEEKQKLLSWVCPAVDDSNAKHAATLMTVQEGTGTWIHKDLGFLTLCNSAGFLWLCGPPGSGKTTLCAGIIDFLYTHYASSSTAITYMYFNSKRSEEDPTQQLLVALTRQLLNQKPESISHVKDLWDSKSGKVTDILTSNDQKLLLRNIANEFEKVFIVVDALDESRDPGEIVEIIQCCRKPHAESDFAAVISSRNSLAIENLMKAFGSFRVTSLANRNHIDLRRYINVSVDKLKHQGKLKFRNPSLLQKTKETVQSKSNGLFLQAKFHLEYLTKMKSDKAITNALDNLPSALDGSYEHILSQIRDEHELLVPEAKRMLSWLSHAMEPLTADVLAEAAVIDDDDDCLDKESIATDPEDLVGILGSLVSFDRRTNPATVFLSHLSVFEYLHSDSIKQSSVSEFSIDVLTSHQYIARACSQYLGFSDFAKPLTIFNRFGDEEKPNDSLLGKELSRMERGVKRKNGLIAASIQNDDISARLQEYALLKYATRYWADHLKYGYSHGKAEARDSTLLAKLRWFLTTTTDSEGNFNSWLEIHRSYCHFFHDCRYYQRPLFFSIVMGLDVCFDALFRGDEDLNSLSPGGWTPLTAAAYGGSTYIVRRLLSAGADVDQKADEKLHNGFRALHLAAENGVVEMVGLLLAYGASVHSRTSTETTPFYRAVRSGCPETLEMLYHAGSDVNARSWDSFTPIMEAVERADLPMVKQLGSWNADPLISTTDGYNIIDMALLCCPVEFVRALQDILVSRGQSEELNQAMEGADITIEDTLTLPTRSTVSRSLKDIEIGL